jgi:hypothetical protein
MRRIIDEGDGYRIRATRKSVGTFEVVAIDWEHPNYGYFADAMLWIWSPHSDEWTPVPIVNWARKYDTVQAFIEDYPSFSDLFENPVTAPAQELNNTSIP